MPDNTPEKKHTKHEGYNVGDVLGFVRAPANTDSWCMAKNQKRGLLGPRLVGDPGAGVGDGSGVKMASPFKFPPVA